MRKGRAFTLVEVMIVVLITGALMAVVMPSLTKARQRASETKLRGDLEALRRAYEACKVDTLGIGPPSIEALASANAPSWGWMDLGTGRGWVQRPIEAGHWNGPYIREMPVSRVPGVSFTYNSNIGRETNQSPIWLSSGSVSIDGTPYNTW